MTKLALIGQGRWGENILRTLETVEDVSVTAIPKGAEVPLGIDGVLIATPSATHADIALPFIEHGVPTFIEKPMTTSVEDALRIRDAARHSHAIVFVGYVHLFNPAFLKMQELLPQVGRIRAIICDGANNSPRTDSSVLWDWLPHDLSMARVLLGGDPETVEAWSLTDAPIPESAVSRFLFSGIPLISTMSWVSPQKRKHVTVVGSKGSIAFDDTAVQKLTLYRSDEVSHPAYADTPPLSNELTAFVESVRTGKKKGPDAEDGLAVVRMVESAETSARSRMPNAIPVNQGDA